MKMELQDLKEQKQEDELEIERLTKELTNAEQFLSFYESTIRQKSNPGLQCNEMMNQQSAEQHQEQVHQIMNQPSTSKNNSNSLNNIGIRDVDYK